MDVYHGMYKVSKERASFHILKIIGYLLLIFAPHWVPTPHHHHYRHGKYPFQDKIV